ncbi:MAG: NAD(P)-dependent alcohol dehydrogenase [Spirochaetota bacterium]
MSNRTMKAAVCHRYGPPEVFRIADVPKPSPKDNEVLVSVHAAGVTASDIFIRSSKMPLRYKIPMRLLMGIFRPRNPILGLVFSGVVETTGKSVQRFSVGDEVFGMAGLSMGVYAEYICIKEKESMFSAVTKKPSNLSHEEATAALYGGLLAYQYLAMGDIKPGDRVLIYGASGTSGTIALQLAKQYGAEVTGVCSGKHLDLVESLGADHVLDYTDDASIQLLAEYDFVLDSVGRMKSSSLKDAASKALKDGGRYVSIDDGDLKLSVSRLDTLRGLYEEGQIKPVLDRSFPLEQIVQAHTYVEGGHKKGGVAVRIQG